MGDNYQTYVEQSAAHVLSNHELLMSTPSASRLTSFYPTPSESQNTIAQAVCNSGQLIVQANSKNFGGSSDFLISSPNLLDNPHLRMSFKIPALGGNSNGDVYVGTYHSGWGFDLIENLEVTFSNSNISNLQITGRAMREWSLMQCMNETERQRMLETAGKHQVEDRSRERVFEATVPLSFMFWRTAGGVKGGFPIDGRALNGPITFRFRLAPLFRVCGPHLSNFNASAVAEYPSSSTGTAERANSHGGVDDFIQKVPSLDNLSISFRTYQLMDGAFSVSKALEANPGFVYSIPSLWLNTYSYSVDLDSNGAGSINLNSAPAGMVQAMFLTFRPENDDGATPAPAAGVQRPAGSSFYRLNYNEKKTIAAVSGTNSEICYRPYVPWSLPLNKLKLSYSGQAIFDARSGTELDQFYADVFQDDLKTKVCGAPLHLSVREEIISVTGGNGSVAALTAQTRNNAENSAVLHNTQTLMIPLMHDGNDVFRKRGFENLPHYSGSTLQLEFNVDPYNTYRTDAKDRRINVDDANGEYKDYTSSGSEKIEKIAMSCHDYPSNRMQLLNLNTTANSSSVLEGNNPTAALDPNSVDATGGAKAFDGSGGKVRVEVTYVIAALFQVTNGVAELQL